MVGFLHAHANTGFSGWHFMFPIWFDNIILEYCKVCVIKGLSWSFVLLTKNIFISAKTFVIPKNLLLCVRSVMKDVIIGY